MCMNGFFRKTKVIKFSFPKPPGDWKIAQTSRATCDVDRKPSRAKLELGCHSHSRIIRSCTRSWDAIHVNKCIVIECMFCFRVSQLTGHEPQDLIEKTMYNLIHTSDMMGIRYSHQMCKYMRWVQDLLHTPFYSVFEVDLKILRWLISLCWSCRVRYRPHL